MAEKRVEAVKEIDAAHTNKTKKNIMSTPQNRYSTRQCYACGNKFNVYI